MSSGGGIVMWKNIKQLFKKEEPKKEEPKKELDIDPIRDSDISVALDIKHNKICIFNHVCHTFIIITDEELADYLMHRFYATESFINEEIFVNDDNYIVCRDTDSGREVDITNFMDEDTVYEKVWHDVEYKSNMDKFYASLPIFGFDKATIITLLDLPDSLIQLLMKE